MQFVAKYRLECSLLSDSVTLAALASVANGKFEQIKAICETGEDHHQFKNMTSIRNLVSHVRGDEPHNAV